MTYPDIVSIATVDSDGYGDNTVTDLTQVKASFIQRSGLTRENNADGETSDAAVYLLPTDSFVLARVAADDLEGMYIQFENKWFRVSDVSVARRKLLNNAIDNIYCRLDKVAGMPYVSVS